MSIQKYMLVIKKYVIEITFLFFLLQMKMRTDFKDIFSTWRKSEWFWT